MSAAANKQPGDVIFASEWNILATTANNGESGASSAQATAAAAQAKADAAYVKPAQGIPVTDLAPGATNTNWISPVNGAWPVRPTTSTNVRYIWLRTSALDPAVIIGGNYAIAGHDLVAQP